ncbi:hypothetical protein [Paenibacillus sp. sgz5001063]|uniref:hypothetical protein n=1 Tax=Paenibacillus sp. sgz5001063 TaxID=3242474 RepID=UPI0036D2DC70
MNISALSSNKLLFTGSNEETINFLAFSNNDLFISKSLIREYDFNGNAIDRTEDKIRIKSIWMLNSKSNLNHNIIQYGNFDINDAYVTENYFYFVKIVDEDNDGLLLDNDYGSGEMWRINKETFGQEFCFKIKPYNFHRFLSANDSFVVFVSEDRIPDVTEIIFYNIITKKFSVLNNIYENDWYDFRVVNSHNGEPEYFIYKKEVDEQSENEVTKVEMIYWSDLITQLEWK